MNAAGPGAQALARSIASMRGSSPLAENGARKPGYAGIRPKIARPGVSTTDFLIETERAAGVPRLINLFWIALPRLAASLAIADLTARGF